MESRFDCEIHKHSITDDSIVYEITGLKEDHFTDILFGFKRKLETTFETSRLYYKVIE
jgi:hypothetical protein